jgi:hypothetical protein
MNQVESKPESNTWKWGTFSLFTIILALIVFYLIYVALTASLFIGDIRAELGLDRPFSGEKLIAGIGALAIVWWRVRSIMTGCGERKVSAISKRRKLVSLLLIVLIPTLFIFIFFVADRGAIWHQTIGRAMEKVLVQNGYCGDKTVDVPSWNSPSDAWRSPCTTTARAMVESHFIPGGEEFTVYGVMEPNILDQIKQAYVTKFLTTPELKHVIVYFDPHPWSQAQSQSKDAFLEMRR